MGVITPIKPDVSKGISAQGRYIVSPDGVALGYNNNRDVERVLTMMDQALIKYNANPTVSVEVEPELLAEQTSMRPPTGTTFVRSFTRILPVPVGSDIANQNVARDHMWITPEESLLMRTTDQVPSSLVTRLCRFHLIDNVRGEPDAWTLSEVKTREFSLLPEGRGKLLRGTYSMQKPSGKLGFEGAVLFRLSWDATGKMSFEGYGESTAWGAGTWTGTPPAGRFKVVQAYVTVNDAMAKVVPPQFIVFGNEYFAK